MALDKTAVKNIAFLSRLDVKDEELDSVADDLNGILAWIEQLQAVDTSDVEPMTSVAQMTLRRREDLITDGGIQEKVLANAPETADGYFLVPKVVE